MAVGVGKDPVKDVEDFREMLVIRRIMVFVEFFLGRRDALTLEINLPPSVKQGKNHLR